MRAVLAAVVWAMAGAATAQSCGGEFEAFKAGLAAEARARGFAPGTVEAFFSPVARDPAVIRADRAQGVFRFDYLTFSRRLISEYRLLRGRENAERWARLFDAIEREHGVPRGLLLAIWAFESDFGAVQGEFNTADALVTLAHDCRRPDLFRPQVFAALEMFRRGDFDPATTTGAWAGEIGQVQMLPGDILEHGADGDGDGHVRLKRSVPDALVSGARLLRAMGWWPGEPWLQEVVLPGAGLDWAETGLHATRPVRDWRRRGVRGRNGPLGAGDLPASILLPMGRGGPAFIAYPNFRVLLEWNRSLVYVTTVAYFATRLEGAPVQDARDPEPGLTGGQMVALQRRLRAMGHHVGGADGVLGAKTRAAVRAVQARLGLPADGWPTPALLARIGG